MRKARAWASRRIRCAPCRPTSLREALAGLDAIDATAPIHIHIAEQTQEVDDCIAWSGQRPVAWLLDHAAVDARWCLVHATHMDAERDRRAAAQRRRRGPVPDHRSQPRRRHLRPAGLARRRRRWGIGSDSHVCVNAAEELLLLEYSQRLATRQRNVVRRRRRNPRSRPR